MFYRVNQLLVPVNWYSSLEYAWCYDYIFAQPQADHEAFAILGILWLIWMVVLHFLPWFFGFGLYF